MKVFLSAAMHLLEGTYDGLFVKSVALKLQFKTFEKKQLRIVSVFSPQQNYCQKFKYKTVANISDKVMMQNFRVIKLALYKLISKDAQLHSGMNFLLILTRLFMYNYD